MTTSLRSETTIDLIISNEHQYSVQSQPLAHNGSDHFPILTEFTDITTTEQINTIPKVNWEIYTTILTILSPEIHNDTQSRITHPSDWFENFQDFLVALKLRATKWYKIKRKRPTISEALRIMLEHKHYLQNRYRHTRTEEDRLNLRTWQKIIQREFKQHRLNKWNQFISNIASPNPSTFWKTVKSLNKNRSIQFSALSDDKYTLNDPVQILSHLIDHFTSRFTPPVTDMNVQTDKEAQELWNVLNFKQVIDMFWQQGLLLKLKRLTCPTPYLLWITNYFKDRTITIDLNGLLSDNITIEGEASQGRVFGAIAYIIAHHDLQQIFERPENNHLYVDDLGSIYVCP
ncbi:unnamed protein product [Rotaria magnacalcarata]|uniref:Reverse transcriptase n=1 Tax=Rotaria magnacalcarata TaxID=392030 RepID=A0A8S2WNV5_9BILA|nr:unnamed protein product [Rotaria magnacalcarata]